MLFLNRKIIKKIREASFPLEPVETNITPYGMENIGVRAVLFDIYGTLFISASGDISVVSKSSPVEVIADILKRYTLLDKDPGSVYNEFVKEIKMEHQRLKKEGIEYPEIVVEEVWKKVLGVGNLRAMMFAVDFEIKTNPVWPMPGAFDIILHLKRKKIVLGVISNAQFYTPLMFKALMGRSISKLGFDKKLMIYSYRYRMAKPSIKLFEIAFGILKEKGINPDQVVYVGNDMLNDMLPARKVGFKTVLFAGDKRSLRLREEDSRCRSINPDAIVKGMQDLGKLLGV